MSDDQQSCAIRAAGISVPPTMAITKRIDELKSSGRDVISLASAETDFDTPEHVKEAAIAAILCGKTRYTPVDGTPRLKQAIIEKFQKTGGLSFKPEQIIVGAGSRQLLSNALAATLSPGDEVVIPAPYWISYPQMVALAGGRAVIAPTYAEQGFKLMPHDLEHAITPQTRWLILNAPGNPTGAVYSQEELVALGAVLKKHPRVWVLFDALYEHIIYDRDTLPTMAKAVPELFERTLTVCGFSAAYNMTGWRIGYAAGPADLVRAMATIQWHTTGNPSAVSQIAAEAALAGPHGFMTRQVAAYRNRRDRVMEMVSAIPGLTCIKPDGAFYLFCGCADVLGRMAPGGKILKTEADVATYLLESEGVAVMPGSAFGCDFYFRMSFAASLSVLEDACTRMGRALEKLKGGRSKAAAA